MDPQIQVPFTNFMNSIAYNNKKVNNVYKIFLIYSWIYVDFLQRLFSLRSFFSDEFLFVFFYHMGIMYA